MMTTLVLPPLKAQKNGAYCYLQTFKNEWVKPQPGSSPGTGKSKPVKGKTKTVAKIEGGGPEGRIIWYDDFLQEHPKLSEVESYRRLMTSHQNSKIKSYQICFEPKDEQVSLRQSLSARVYLAGHTWVLDHIIRDTPLERALEKVFAQFNRNKKIISLAYYMYLQQSSALECYSSFAEINRLPWQKPLTLGQCSKLFQSISYTEIDNFLKALNEEICRQEEENAGKINVYYLLDSTSVNTHDRKLPPENFDYNRDGDDLKQFNLLMLVNKETGVPAYYRAFHGEVPDVSTVLFTLQEFARLGMNRQAIVVCDRGYSSITSIHRFLKTKTQFLLNMRTTFTVCRNLICHILHKLNNPESYEPDIKQHVLTEEFTLSYPVNYQIDCKHPPRDKARLYAHIYLDKDIRHMKESSLTQALSTIGKKILAGKALSDLENKLADKYLTVTLKKGKVTNVAYEHNAIAQTTLMDGIMVLLTDAIKDPIEAYRAYCARFQVELSFAAYKQSAGGDSTRASTVKTAEGKLFTQFVAAAIATMFRFQISCCRFKGFNLPFDGDRQILDKLKGIRAAVWDDGLYYSEILGVKKQLLEALNIPIPKLERFTGSELEDLQSVDKEAEEEEDEMLNMADYLSNMLIDND